MPEASQVVPALFRHVQPRSDLTPSSWKVHSRLVRAVHEDDGSRVTLVGTRVVSGERKPHGFCLECRWIACAHPQGVLLAAFSRPLSWCFQVLDRPPVLRLWCADETSSAQWTICVPSLHLQTRRREEARKGRWAGGDQAHPQALLPSEHHRASVGGTGPVPLRFWPSTRLLHMKDEATDRFRRDPILLCNRTK